MTTSNQLIHNQLLSALPALELSRLSPHLERIELKLGEILHESGKDLSYVYFPTSSVLSVVYDLANGLTSGIGVVGNEGVLGISIIMGGDKTIGRAIAQTAGSAYRIKSEFLLQEFNLEGILFSLLLRYTLAFMTQTTQTGVCNSHHSINQQLSRWLLFSMDRQLLSSLTMTHNLIANMLGVRREGVTEAAGKLQDLGLITYKRGIIDIIDRLKLERESCECYGIMRTEYNRLNAAMSNSHHTHFRKKQAILPH